MAITTKPVAIPAKLVVGNEIDGKAMLGVLQALIDRVEKPRVEAVADLGQTISGTYSQAEVQAISDKLDEVLAALRTASILEAS